MQKAKYDITSYKLLYKQKSKEGVKKFMSVNKFVLNETSYFGKGARGELPEEIRKRGFKKVLLVTDKTLIECGVATKVTEVLDNAGIAYETYSEIKQFCFP